MQTQTERDVEGLAAKKEREREGGVPAEFASEEITGRLQGEELMEARAHRPTDERIGRLEQKHDQLAQEVGGVRVEVAKMSGKLEVLPQLVDAVKEVGKHANEREHIRLTAQVDIDKANAKDVIDGRRSRRLLIAKVVLAVLGVVTSVEFVRYFFLGGRG